MIKLKITQIVIIFWVASLKKYKEELLKGQGQLTEKQEAYFDGIEIEYNAIIDFVERLYRLAKEKKTENWKAGTELYRNLDAAL